ncbi:MAG: Fe-S cluster assembly protein SufD [Schleiferiaceae bacterium]
MESLKEKLVSSFIIFESDHANEVDTDLHERRQSALKRFEGVGFPTKKDEEWKYTNLKPILKNDFKVFPGTEETIELKDVKKYFLNDIDTYKLVFINGVFSSWLSETTHNNWDICTFGAALKKYRDVLDQYFNKTTPADQPMVDVNTAFAKEGAFIRIPKGKVVDKPIQMIFLNTAGDKEIMVQPRNLIVVEEGAQVEIVERHQNISQEAVLTNSVTEIFAHANSKVDLYKVQNDHASATLIDNTFIEQKRDSEVTIGTFSFGSKLIRNNLHFYLTEPNCVANMDGITLIDGQQTVDHHTLADHQAPHCNSNELYKGIFDEKAHGVFNGKVIVHQAAQKTDAFQANNNVLLSDMAQIDTKPQLEIFADDVKCSHGCTVGQLDEDAMFYLQSRGIGTKEARAMLMYAFTNDALERVKIDSLKKKLNILIARKLGVNLDFEL